MHACNALPGVARAAQGAISAAFGGARTSTAMPSGSNRCAKSCSLPVRPIENMRRAILREPHTSVAQAGPWSRRVRRQLAREDVAVARCTVERLMRSHVTYVSTWQGETTGISP